LKDDDRKPGSDTLNGLEVNAENVDRVSVTVSYLEMNATGVGAPEKELVFDVTWVEHPQVSYYRYLYNTVGQPWMWWRRRLIDDQQLQQLLDSVHTRIYVLSRGGQPAGFFELDLSGKPDIELAYFGLMPFEVGHGRGRVALKQALDAIVRLNPRKITVNTCTVDHPRALGMYQKAGFRIVGTKVQHWEVPSRLGLAVPLHVRQG
jgi:GNAT superfamily N-acetyltransferase